MIRVFDFLSPHCPVPSLGLSHTHTKSIHIFPAMHLRRNPIIIIIIIPLLFSLLSLTNSLPPENHLLLPSSRKLGRDDSVYCLSWRFSVEVNDAGEWSTIPLRCLNSVSQYMTGEIYSSDSEIIAGDSLEFAKSVRIAGDGKDAWVFDVDETLLTNLPYYEAHGFGSEVFNEGSFDEWMVEAKAPALTASLSLYNELQQLGFKIVLLTGRSEPYRNCTTENLKLAGYDNWERLILRGPSDKGKSATVYKSERRKELIDEGYRIHGNSGDQWSDLIGFAVADRSFKLPNPMYYIA